MCPQCPMHVEDSVWIMYSWNCNSIVNNIETDKLIQRSSDWDVIAQNVSTMWLAKSNCSIRSIITDNISDPI